MYDIKCVGDGVGGTLKTNSITLTIDYAAHMIISTLYHRDVSQLHVQHSI